ncbi:TetR/AcrR family transcriptional regulator [Frankia sp. CNm7]|uniref:TetR/AcrR family transcriptional regulator n=1 Tax=Frankia nepalensis TaxID=1836974 RepID=A0A937RRI3_9ACTN|nr:TetR/AcrR family transcriptional regulator [Frankia nepalensis]MBL7501893.1 TetR/AcrR family transcriptional regulator [Frankia nepalensis]MBL7511634.1 TetR/AcrR family transcriptional regulator [Frankia nepalensis]MBL7523660.1 TetR/AcrR family transcriptional regulator [Frankia nepalensis]MBL7633625.1 TetR/AcrR family transcriptional regulator [Frankia nepalensis]
MVSQHRATSAESARREQLLDAAEYLLLEEGYAAVTSRRVGARAGLTPQLVHYYFHTMDDLFLQVFRRRADPGLELLREALGARPTLRQLWELRETSVTTSRFNLEFMALANHRKAIRSTIVEYYRRYRQIQLDAFTAALTDLGIPPERCPPLIAQLAMIGMTQIMTIDVDLGIATDYEAVSSFIDEQIQGLVERQQRASNS